MTCFQTLDSDLQEAKLPLVFLAPSAGLALLTRWVPPASARPCKRGVCINIKVEYIYAPLTLEAGAMAVVQVLHQAPATPKDNAVAAIAEPGNEEQRASDVSYLKG